MVAATRIASRLRVCEDAFPGRLQNLLRRAGLPLAYPKHRDLFEAVLRALQLDKKFRNGKNLFVLSEKPGSWRPVEDISWDIVHEAVEQALE
jgi:3-dehydroquinate synthetase